MKTEFAKNLRKYRKRKGLTQAELAAVLGYGATAVTNYELGRTEPCFSDLILLADFLNISTDILLGRRTES